jgi:glutathione synthase/RimK-type ligase-like ATP-grasp enzyme
MKIAIHATPWGFATDWIQYCQDQGIPYKKVDCYRSDIVAQVDDCEVVLWHYHHALAKDWLAAQPILFALETAGKRVFPDFRTAWHFDDKVGQKYLLEAVGAPLVPTTVFYDRAEALEWVRRTEFPKVFKLRGGAGSQNVRLVRTGAEAGRLVKQAFGRGFPVYDRIGDLRERMSKFRLGGASGVEVLKSAARVIRSTEFARTRGPDRGYVYFQDFIPDNAFDIRIIVIGQRAFGIKRLVREGDFRASGSGRILYDRESLDERCVHIAFDTTRRIGGQCLAYDFVFDEQDRPLIVEINYGYAKEGYAPCPGYWDDELNWHEGNFNPQHWIIEDLLTQTKLESA